MRKSHRSLTVKMLMLYQNGVDRLLTEWNTRLKQQPEASVDVIFAE